MALSDLDVEINFIATGAGEIAESMDINSKALTAEMYDDELETLEINDISYKRTLADFESTAEV